MRVECPICEATFQVDADERSVGPSTELTCPTCGHDFRYQPGMQVSAPRPVSSRKGGPAMPPRPVSRRADEAPTRSAPPPFPDPAQQAAVEARLALQRRQRNVRWIAMSAAILVVTGIGLLFLIPELVRQPENGAEAASDPGEAVPSQMAATDAGTGNANPLAPPGGQPPEGNAGLADARGDTSAQPSPDSEAGVMWEPPPRRILSAARLDETWRKVQPHLLQLTAETPYGARRATGLIIDSRGWVVTSYRAMQGAREISVRQSVKSMEDSSDRLTDLVRGVVATAPQHDLAILQVNRRFVVSFRELTLQPEDRVVASQHLICCVPPTRSYAWPVAECRIQQRQRLEGFDESLRSDLVASGLDDETLSWIIHECRSPYQHGAILVNDQADVVGMTIATGDNVSALGKLLAVPADRIAMLKASASDELQPLPLQPLATGRAARNNPAKTDAGDGLGVAESQGLPPVLPRDSLRRLLSVNLNQAGRDCRQFGWWPTDDAQRDQFQEFADLLMTAARLVQDEPEDEEDVSVIRQQIEYWWQDLQQVIPPRPPLAAEQMAEHNRAWEPALRSEADKFVAFGSVYRGAMLSPELDFGDKFWDETITFQLLDGDLQILVRNGEDWPVMRPETRWLLWGEKIPGRVTVTNKEGEDPEECHLARIYFVMPVEP